MKKGRTFLCLGWPLLSKRDLTRYREVLFVHVQTLSHFRGSHIVLKLHSSLRKVELTMWQISTSSENTDTALELSLFVFVWENK